MRAPPPCRDKPPPKAPFPALRLREILDELRFAHEGLPWANSLPSPWHVRSVSLLLLLLCGGAAGLHAQAAAEAPALPEDPGQYLVRQLRASADSARITGTVIDINGGLVPGAEITVLARDRPGARYSAIADANGSFSIGDLPPGSYTLTISSPGLEIYTERDIRLRAGQSYAMPRVSLPIARTSADVTVTLTEEQVAETQLHAELQQRVFGVFPNFYSTFEWEPHR